MKKLFDELMKKMAEANEIAQQLEKMGKIEFAALTVYPYSGKNHIQFHDKGFDFILKTYGLQATMKSENIRVCEYARNEFSIVEVQNETDD